MEQSSLQIEQDYGLPLNDTLICPNCSSNNLHHLWVKDYSRAEDAEPVVTLVRGIGKVSRMGDDGRNPSARRDGIRIGFCCELCDAHIEMAIAQHKGLTYLWMESTPEGRAANLAIGE